MKSTRPGGKAGRAEDKRNLFPLVFGAVLGLLAALGLVTMVLKKPLESKSGAGSNAIQTAVQSSGALPGGTNQSSIHSNAAAPATPVIGLDNPNAEDSVALLAQGTERLNHGDYKEALAKFQEALKIVPEDEDLHYNLGIAYSRLNDKTNAQKHYEEALRIFPDYAEVHNNLGNLLMSNGKFAEAIEHFEKAIELQPDSPSAHNNLGTAKARQGQVNEAVVQYMEAIRLQPDYLEARCNLANAYLSENRVDEAAEEFQKVLRVRPNFEPAIRGMNRARQKKSAQ
jgi:type IV pilus biogenesis/stability protein PilW